MHRRNIIIDEYKTKWALLHGIPIMRIWEYDINHSPLLVMQELKEMLGLQEKEIILEEKKKKRQVNKLKAKKPLKKGEQLLLF